MSKLYLLRQQDGSLALQPDTPNETAWLLTDYTEQPCDPDVCGCTCHDVDDEANLDVNCECVGPYDCTECGQPIYGPHYVCMDNGADSTHVECTTVIDRETP